MVKFYALQVKMGKITLAAVPERYRAAVSKSLGGDTDADY